MNIDFMYSCILVGKKNCALKILHNSSMTGPIICSLMAIVEGIVSLRSGILYCATLTIQWRYSTNVIVQVGKVPSTNFQWKSHWRTLSRRHYSAECIYLSQYITLQHENASSHATGVVRDFLIQQFLPIHIWDKMERHLRRLQNQPMTESDFFFLNHEFQQLIFQTLLLRRVTVDVYQPPI